MLLFELLMMEMVLFLVLLGLRGVFCLEGCELRVDLMGGGL